MPCLRRTVAPARIAGPDPAALRPRRAQHAGTAQNSDFGYPCRVSLEDAAIGDELLLLSYPHLNAASPYRASGPIYVRRHAVPRRLAPGEVPPVVTRRLMSLRAYDGQHLMVDGQVVEGTDVAAALGALFDRADVAYVHLHNAKRGCYSCLAQRTPAGGAG